MSPPAEAISAANRLAEVVEELRADLRVATDSFDKSRAAFETSSRRSRYFLILIGVVLALVGWLAVANRSTAQHVATQTVTAKAQATCVRDYANQTAKRSNTLLPLSNARSDALDALIRTLPLASTETPAQQKARFTAALFKYLQASDAYSAAVQSNPLPLAPKFTC